MNEHLRDRIVRRLDTLSDERGYEILDYVEFLESKYAERPTSSTATAFTRFTEAVEDKLRAGKVSASAIAETVGFMNRAANVLNNAVEAGKSAVEAGKSAATEFVSAAQRTSSQFTARPSTPPAEPPTTPPASSPAHDTQAPGSGEEKL